MISYLFLLETNGMFLGKNKDSKKEEKGKCSLYKGHCGGSISNKCCKIPYKCAKQTELCGKNKLCCVSEADIEREKQANMPWTRNRNG